MDRPHIVYLVHGIRQRPSRADAWMQALAARVTAADHAAMVRIHLYGFLGAMAVRAPFVGRRIRRAYVRELQDAVAADRRIYPNATIDLIGHSFGTYLAWHSMTQSKGPRAFYRNLVFMGGVVSSRETFEREGQHFKGILNLYSRSDEIVAIATFGHSGWSGFQHDGGGRVRNLSMAPYEHKDYERPGPAWDEAQRFVNAA